MSDVNINISRAIVTKREGQAPVVPAPGGGTVNPGGMFVQSVRGGVVDNTDPYNPIINIDPSGEQNNVLRVIQINESDLPANYTKADVAAYLNTIEIIKEDIETLGVEVISSEANPIMLMDTVTYYKFDETSGNTATDSIGSVNGVISNTDLGITGKLGNAYNFKGLADSNVTISGFSLGSQVSVNFWCKLEVHIPTDSSKTGLVAFNSVMDQATLYPWTNGDLYISIFTNQVKLIGAGIVADRTQWHMITVTADSVSNEWKFYQNGQLAFTSTVGSIDYFADFIIGRSNATRFLNGSIDEISFHNKVLSLGEIETLYNSGNGRTI